jgi:hypothetical protein
LTSGSTFVFENVGAVRRAPATPTDDAVDIRRRAPNMVPLDRSR